MSRPSQTTVLISGASRGLGLGLLKLYLAKPNHTVIAANRSLTSAKDLAALPAAEGSRVIVVKVDASVESEAFQAANELVEKHGIQSLDIVVSQYSSIRRRNRESAVVYGIWLNRGRLDRQRRHSVLILQRRRAQGC